MKASQESIEQQRAKDYEQKEKAFEDFMSGKQKINDDMNLQDVFKTFYQRAKNIDIKKDNVVNSAMSSLSGFSSKLEARRQAARDKKAQAAQKTQEAKPEQSKPKEEAKPEAEKETEEKVEAKKDEKTQE